MILASACAVLLATTGITDLSRHAPADVALPAAGGSYVDPVFGARITRVTDERDGTLCTHAYAYWTAFNADSTRLLLSCDGRHLLYRFQDGVLTPDGLLEGDDGVTLQFEGASWAWTDPDRIYALEGTRLWRVDVTQRGRAGYTMIRDFAGLFAYPFELWQLHVAADHVFTFHSRDPMSGAKLDAVVYDSETAEVWVLDRQGFQIDETKVDKLGRVVMVDGSEANRGFKLWDFRAGLVDDFGWNPEDRPTGHFDMGASFIANSDGWETGLLVRKYDATRGLTNIVRYLRGDGSLNWTISDHVSLRADDETYVLASTYGGDDSWEAFEDEIFLARTDGGGFVRLAHTRSTAREYYAFPRAVIDRSGRWVVYASDLGSPARIDVMLLEVPEEYVTAPDPSPDPDPAPEPAPDPGPQGEPMTRGTMTGGCAVGTHAALPWWAFLALAIALAGLRRPSGSRGRTRRDRTAA